MQELAHSVEQIVGLEGRDRSPYFGPKIRRTFPVVAGRAAEELLYGVDEMSTINQRRLVLARRIVQKLVVAGAMSDNPDVGPRTISTPKHTGAKALKQLVLSRVGGGGTPHARAWRPRRTPHLTRALPVAHRMRCFCHA
jgi:hypothetical protein